MNKTEAREFPIQLISINMKSTFVLEPLKGDCFLHETARWNFQLVLRKICSHDCELQSVATKSCVWTQPWAPGCAELLPCPSALQVPLLLTCTRILQHMQIERWDSKATSLKWQAKSSRNTICQPVSTATCVVWIEFPELDRHLCHSEVRHGLWLPIGSHQDTPTAPLESC